MRTDVTHLSSEVTSEGASGSAVEPRVFSEAEDPVDSERPATSDVSLAPPPGDATLTVPPSGRAAFDSAPSQPVPDASASAEAAPSSGGAAPSGRAGSRAKGAAHWLGVAAAAFLVGHFFDAMWSGAARLINGGSPPPLGTQLNSVIASAGRDGLRLLGPVHLVQFRAAGPKSRVLLFRPISPTDPRSDELRIYDVVGHRLRKGLAFEPAASSTHLGASNEASGPRAFGIHIRLIRNLDGQPGDEIIADIAEYAVTPLWPRPIYIDWNVATQKYEVGALLSPATTGKQTMKGVITTRYERPSDVYTTLLMKRVYLRPTTVVDATGSVLTFDAFAVEAFSVRQEPLEDPRGQTEGGLALSAGYIVRSSGFGTADLLQALTWHIDLRQDPPRARATLIPPHILKVGTNWSRLTQLLEEVRG